MIKKILQCIFVLALVLAVFNYDKVAEKILKCMPSSLNNYLAERYMPEKFWLHRVNSVDKQKEFANKYKGLEFDIIYYEQEHAFENSHDKENLQLYNLEKQFQQYERMGKNNELWLDFKNLSDKNKNEALTVLIGLIDKYHIDKNKILVESGNWQALSTFKKAGFKTSYYFPYYKFDKMKKEEIEQSKILTEKIANSGNVDAVSFYGEYYDFINSLDLPPRLALLSWLDGKNWYEVLLLKKYAEIRNDNRVKVILVRDRGHYSR